MRQRQANLASIIHDEHGRLRSIHIYDYRIEKAADWIAVESRKFDVLARTVSSKISARRRRTAVVTGTSQSKEFLLS